ncbi:hypothetical protein N7520_005535 [Penicillium odoratum]|uniref:uncharacterized protein n=1 Tax=Penicillium odoratum TaxID=1167516 RepID=UPI002548A813|nr:uncharacterized protein N7520_005535 [Penicillium odoratum]KAJ5758379.1 hypothetical protein N7520_005535 [Penicillium odoratum]
MSEFMPLLDAPRALKAFHTLMHPVCDAIYDRMATRICQFLLPFKGAPGEPFHRHGAEGQVSFLEIIALPASEWQNVERHKWNCDYPLLFNSPKGFDFEFQPVDRRADGEITHDIVDREFWAHEWDADDVKAYLDSVYPHYREQAGESHSEMKTLRKELRVAMGGKQKVTFSVVLVLGTKK